MRSRLSQAILTGSAMTEQAFDEFFDPKGNTCALGAAAKAIGDSAFTYRVSIYWPWLKDDTRLHKCPAYCPGSGLYQWQMIVHLNDYHHWTRERIAEWVATIEPWEPSELDTVETREPSKPDSAARKPARPARKDAAHRKGPTVVASRRTVVMVFGEQSSLAA
jgi:hypothetical protein